MKNAKLDWWIQNYFSGKAIQTLKLFQNFLSLLELPINLFSSHSKAQIEPSEWSNIEIRLKIAKFGQRIQNCFARKERQVLKHSRKFLPILELPINFFSQSNEWLHLLSCWTLYKANKCQISSTNTKWLFLEKLGKPLNFPRKFSSY